MRLQLLGAFHLERDGEKISLPRRKTEALLAYLALHPEPHAREKLAALFWGDAPDESARASLRNELATLRKLLGADALLADRETVQWNPNVALWIDARELQRGGWSVEGGATSSLHAPPSTLYIYSDLLPDFYDDWILQLREELRAKFIDALLGQIQWHRSQSEYARAIEYAQRVLQIDRANERAHQHLMFCFVGVGDRSAALKQFDECVAALRDELAVEPSADTRALVEWIRSNGATQAARSFAARITNLPLPLTSFVGRQRETATLKTLLRNGKRGTRDGQLAPSLVTLTGAGGSGKTRLALQVGTDLVDAYRDGVWWIELAALSDATAVPLAVAQALGIQEQAQQAVITTLTNVLREREQLLILDNCEHLVEACAQLADALLTQCPRLQILATSREGLNVSGEVTWLVPLLAVPRDDKPEMPTPEPHSHVVGDAAALALNFESVRLFVERAALVQRAFQLNDGNVRAVIEICRRLDGIPLAIELAAARVKTLPVEQIAARLQNRFELLTTGARTALPRQQTLRALIDWSYDLLSEDERALLQRLSVFAGGWTLEAAEACCSNQHAFVIERSGKQGSVSSQHPLDADYLSQDTIVLDTLTRLMDKSLVLVIDNGARYMMLETIREYAREKLWAAQEYGRVAERHLAYFDALAFKGTSQMFSSEQLVWLERFEAERDNLRAALEFGLAQEDATRAVRRAGNLGPFWQLRNYWSEGREWSERALRQMRETQAAGLRAKTWGGAGVLAWLQGDYQIALQRHERSRVLFEQAGDAWGSANATMNIGPLRRGVGAVSRRACPRARNRTWTFDFARLEQFVQYRGRAGARTIALALF